jgi:hypothetical protein
MRPTRNANLRLRGRPLRHALLTNAVLLALALTPVAHAIVDSDGDGMSDVWEALYGFTVGTGAPASEGAGADPDGDGWTNFHEALAGTDPNSAVQPAGIVRADIERDTFMADTFYISWQSDPTKAYQLKCSPDLQTWVDVGESTAGNGEVIVIGASGMVESTDPENPLPETSPQMFWRVVIEDMDSDGDGLVNFEENVLGLDSALLDEDGDGIPSYIEILHGWNPLVANPATDLAIYLATEEESTFQVYTPLH